MRGEHEEAVELASKRLADARAETGLLGCESGGGGSKGDGKEGKGGGVVRGGMEEGEERRVPLDHGEERAGGGRVEVGAAAREDAEGEEVLRFRKEQCCKLADETKMTVLRGVAVERREPNHLQRRQRRR